MNIIWRWWKLAEGSDKKIRVGIFGVSGQTGEELLRWLSWHRFVDLVYVASRDEAGKRLGQLYPWVKWKELEIQAVDCNLAKKMCDCIFLALPHTVSKDFVPKLYPEVVVIDLSADFRFESVEVYERTYNTSHSCPKLLDDAVYGLCEVFKDEIRQKRLISNPGCYPTAVLLGLFPLSKHDLISSVIIDAKSAASGAGKKLLPNLLFVNMDENLFPYKPNTHQHIPEILQFLNVNQDDFIFVPHIVGVERGILCTMFVELTKKVEISDIERIYSDFYKDSFFVRIISDGLPSYKAVIHTNQCHIGFRMLSGKKLMIVSAIDNLIKGASGQAVQNMNLVFDFDEQEGLR